MMRKRLDQFPEKKADFEGVFLKALHVFQGIK